MKFKQKQLPLHLWALLGLTFAIAACAAMGSSTSTNKNVKPDLILHTNYGDIAVELFENTPKHRANFLRLADQGFYDGVGFHRIIKEFMIQGGDPNTKDPDKASQWGQGGPGYTLPAEIQPEYVHTKGMLAAARLGDQVNPDRNSSGSQFYIVTGRTFSDAEIDRAEMMIRQNTQNPNFSYSEEQREAYKNMGGAPWLDGQYTIFGQVVEGMEVVDKIGKVATGRGDVPNEPVIIESVKVKAKVPKEDND